MANHKESTKRQANKLGAFGGVFTPSVLTILGVILFLRYDTIVGLLTDNYSLISNNCPLLIGNC